MKYKNKMKKVLFPGLTQASKQVEFVHKQQLSKASK